MKAVLPHICFLEFAYDGPRDGPPLHDHDDQVDSFYVLDGEIEFEVEGSVHAGGPGTLASIPRGLCHTFRHTHDGGPASSTSTPPTAASGTSSAARRTERR